MPFDGHKAQRIGSLLRQLAQGLAQRREASLPVRWGRLSAETHDRLLQGGLSREGQKAEQEGAGSPKSPSMDQPAQRGESGSPVSMEQTSSPRAASQGFAQGRKGRGRVEVTPEPTSPTAGGQSQGGAADIPQARLLKRWQPHSEYAELNERIHKCRACGGDKIGFVPNYGMGFVPVQDEGMEDLRPEVVVVADPPLNFLIKGELPSTPKLVFVSGKGWQSTWRDELMSEDSWEAAQWLQQEYKNYFPRAVAMFYEVMVRGGYNLQRVLQSAIGRCFVTREQFKRLFGPQSTGPECRDWLGEELAWLVQKSPPKGILLLSSHFARLFLGLDQGIDDLRPRRDLTWKGVPLQVTYHPFQWLRHKELAQRAAEDIEALYNKTVLS